MIFLLLLCAGVRRCRRPRQNHIFTARNLLIADLTFYKLVFALGTFRAYPVRRQFFEQRPRSRAGILVPNLRDILIATPPADIPLADWGWFRDGRAFHFHHWGRRLFLPGAQGFGQQGQDFIYVPHNPIVAVLKDWRISIFIDCHNSGSVLDAL